MAANLENFDTMFGDTFDFVKREIRLAGQPKVRATVLYVDGLVDKTRLELGIMRGLMAEAAGVPAGARLTAQNILNRVRDTLLIGAEIEEVTSYRKVADAVLYGNTVILIDGLSVALVVDTKGWETRAVDEPRNEPVVAGPREAFVEVLKMNVSLVRRRLRTPDLRIRLTSLGRVTHTDVAVAYIKDIASPELVAEVERRLGAINIDGVLDAGYIQELIEDAPLSPFPQVVRTERPDRVAADLLEGRVAIFVDGSPAALIMPTILIQFLQASEDYYERAFLNSALRFGRFVALLAALSLPGLYVAILTFHVEAIPFTLLLGLVPAAERVPFPAGVETLIVLIIFEALKEAGVRLPRPVGVAVSIVGALVLGEAGISARLVSPSTAIIVATTGLASFSLPGFPLARALRLLQFLILFLGSTLGLYGIAIGWLGLVSHLAALKSFGVPYLAPFAPFRASDMKDTLARVPWWLMLHRPRSLGPGDRRQRLLQAGRSQRQTSWQQAAAGDGDRSRVDGGENGSQPQGRQVGDQRGGRRGWILVRRRGPRRGGRRR